MLQWLQNEQTVFYIYYLMCFKVQLVHVCVDWAPLFTLSDSLLTGRRRTEQPKELNGKKKSPKNFQAVFLLFFRNMLQTALCLRHTVVFLMFSEVSACRVLYRQEEWSNEGAVMRAFQPLHSWSRCSALTGWSSTSFM